MAFWRRHRSESEQPHGAATDAAAATAMLLATDGDGFSYDDDEAPPGGGIRRLLPSSGGYDRTNYYRHETSPSTTRAGGVAEGSGGAIHLMLASTLARRVGQLYAASTFLVLLAVIVLLSVDAAREYRSRPDFAAFYSAAVVVVGTVAMSTRQIYRQMTNWFMPDVQKYVVRILWMVPLYSLQSWCSLRFHGSRIYIDAVRDLYEAFVIQGFVYYIIELLGGEDELVAKLRAKNTHLGEHQSFFACFFGRWDMGREFMLHCKYGVLQYVVAKTLCTVATVILEEFDLYGEGSYSFEMGYLYISTIINVSQCWALYCLIKLFHATAEDLRSPKNWHPLGKFLCVKGVVFFTWWQSLGIFFLKANGIIGSMGNWDADDVANGIQDYLICVEMFGFAIAHGITFTEQEYLPSGYNGRSNRSGTTVEGSGAISSGIGYHRSRLRASAGRQGLDYHEEMEHNDHNDDDGDYRPPTIRTLHTPMGIRDAFWSSTVPTEALEDIRRLRNGVSSQVMNADDGGLITLASMQHAEAI